MITRGEEVLELIDHRGMAFFLPLPELDALIAALELVRKSEREGLHLEVLQFGDFKLKRWRAQ